MISLPPEIDAAMPYVGVCGVLDAIASRLTAGDTADEIAPDYGLTVEMVEQIGEHWHEKQQAWLSGRHELTWINCCESVRCEWSEFSLVACSCGWMHSNSAILPASARRAWRRHLDCAT